MLRMTLVPPRIPCQSCWGIRSTGEEAKELGGPGLVHTASDVAEPRVDARRIHRLGGVPGRRAVVEVRPLVVICVVPTAGGFVPLRTGPEAQVPVGVAATVMAIVSFTSVIVVSAVLPTIDGVVVACGIKVRSRGRASWRTVRVVVPPRAQRVGRDDVDKHACVVRP